MATTTGKTMSSSCQSIATAASSAATTVAAVSISASNATSVGSLIAAQQQQHSHPHPHQRGEPMSQHYVNGTGSLGRLKFHKSLDASDEELDYPQLSQSTHILGRYKSERFLAGVSKPDEDRRRRTIIVEKKGDSYGFTLQSYGIHYKRDEELEMITYVDYVEYGGPAYRAGMREGDVILSINGSDMEKADHKTIVEFIKQCDSRMRMVVLFEDCVRKVDLHMRYIQLQSMLQQKMNELERVHLRERELLEGKWKTHSLPARKKQNAHNNNSPSDAEGISPTEMGGAGDIGGAGDAIYYRPTLSTEDVPKQMQIAAGGISGIGGGGGGGGAIIPPPAQFMLTYHYLDPTYRYVLRPHQHPAAAGSDDYLDAVSLQRSQSDQNQQQRFILQRAESMDTNTPASQYHTVAGPTTTATTITGGGKPPAPPPRTCEKHKPPAKPPKMEKTKGSSKHCHKGHSCNPCLGHFRWKSTEKTSAIPPGAGAGGGDNVSLDAYDLASPCCNTECVPTRRRHHHHREHTHKHKHRERERERDKEKVERTRPKSQSHASPNSNSNGGGGGATASHHHHHHHHHQQQQQQPQQQQHIHYHPQTTTNQSQTGSMRSRYFDLASGLASHCSLHSCTSSEFAPADSTSYTTSISTDTLFWDPKSEANSRQPSTKSRQSSYDQQQSQTQSQQAQPQPQPQPHHHHHHHPIGAYHHRYHVMATQVQPSQIYPNLPMAYVQKPKSWDNLAATTGGGSGGGGGGGAATLGGASATYGYGYLDTVAIKPPVKLQIAQQRHSMPRIRNPYGRYSTYGDVENYAPPPTEFVGELTTTTTTTITAKSTEELLTACDCLTPQQQQALKAAQYQLSQNQKMTHQNSCQMGYYSHLPRPTTDVGTSTTTTTSSSNTTTTNNMGQQHHNGAGDVSTVSEATRL